MAAISCFLLIMVIIGINGRGEYIDTWDKVEDKTPAALMSHLVALYKTRAPRHPDVQPETVRYILHAFRRIAQSDQGGQAVAYNQQFMNTWPPGGSGVSWNVVLELRGARWGQSTDQVSVVGAHHDVINGTTGVNDNSAGVAVLMEVGRRLAAKRRLNTVILVSFDREEENMAGSRVFLNEKLIPDILEPFNISCDTFHGAYILDTILNYDDLPNSQDENLVKKLSMTRQEVYSPVVERLFMGVSYNSIFPEEAELVIRNQLRGDFLVVLGRRHADSALLRLAQKHWQNVSGSLLPDVSNSRSLLTRPFPFPDHLAGSYGDALRSDHANFWMYKGPYVTNKTQNGLRALFFTDTANYRGYMRQCYHKACDDLRHVTAKRLDFLSITTTSISNLLVEVSGSGASCIHIGIGSLGILITLSLIYFHLS